MNKAVIIVLVILGSMFVAGLIGVGTWLGYVVQDPTGVSVVVNAPAEIPVGTECELVITVKNERANREFKLTDIDLGDDYLEGFRLLDTKPAAESSMHIPIDNSRSFTFNTPIPANQSKTFTFRLRAEKDGLYQGDIDICEGQRFLTKNARTVVVPASQ